MNYCLFAIYEAPVGRSPALADTFGAALSARPASLGGALGLDLFLPEPEPTVLFDDGPPPAAILQFSVGSRAMLDNLAGDTWFRRSFLTAPLEEQTLSFGAFRMQASPVTGDTGVRPRAAGLSFVVRYFGPMADEDAFVDFYTANHPPILGRLPNIRNVRCYLPERLPGADLPPAQARFINEVVFDDVADLNAALQSDVVTDLRADSSCFPPYGHSTHHAMCRETLLSLEIE